MQTLIFAATAGVAAYWTGAHLALGGPGLLSGSLVLACVAALMAVRLLAEPPVLLAWDGTAWSLRGADGEACQGRPEPMLDLGHWMLVRFVFPRDGGALGRPARWLPLSRRDAGPDWSALRVDLHHDRAADGPSPAA